MASPVMATGRKARRSLIEADANGDGAGVDVAGYQTLAVQVVEAGTLSAGTITLEVSLDGETWMATSVTYEQGTDSSGDVQWLANSPASYARASLASYSGSGSFTAYIAGA